MVEKRQRKGKECNYGIRNRDLKQQLYLGSKETFYEAVRQIIGLDCEAHSRVFGKYSKYKVKTMWTGWPPPK
jgi:hypothetical protein